MKKYLLAGLLVWMPLAITVWVLTWLLGVMDGLFAWLLIGAAGAAAGVGACQHRAAAPRARAWACW